MLDLGKQAFCQCFEFDSNTQLKYSSGSGCEGSGMKEI
jgi:hypothetical protein